MTNCAYRLSLDVHSPSHLSTFLGSNVRKRYILYSNLGPSEGLKMMPTRTVLTAEEMPRKWYNILPDLPEPLAPPLNPATKQPISPSDLEVIFPKALIAQEMATDRYIDIPEEVQQAYMLANRPSPLQRAIRLEKELKTPAKIYFK